MNPSRERHTIFHGDEYYLCFLETLAQAQLALLLIKLGTKNQKTKDSVVL
jgi:hypothetical protein